MKALLFLGLVGAAIYGALILSYDYLIPSDPAENAFAGQSLGNPSDRQLRSWGTDLPSLASSQEAQLALPKAAATPPSSSPSAASEARPTYARSDGTAYQQTEWATVVLAAKVHGEASVSSPTLRFYQPGTALQVVSRRNGWIQIIDPTSEERGWVLEQYLVPADGPAATQTALTSNAGNVAAQPPRANSASRAKKRVRAARPAARMHGNFAATQFDRRWERRAARRGGLFFLGRFARAE
jgi:hypothetical protein